MFPNIRDPVLRSELAKGTGHNTMLCPTFTTRFTASHLLRHPLGLVLWIVVCLVCFLGLPTEVGEPADPFATPLEILPEWFLLPSFEILRAVPNKLLGISGMVLIPVGLASVPWLEASNPFANPLRRGSGTWLFVVGLVVSLALGDLSALPLGQTL